MLHSNLMGFKFSHGFWIIHNSNSSMEFLHVFNCLLLSVQQVCFLPCSKLWITSCQNLWFILNEGCLMHKTKCKSLIYIYVVVSLHLPHQFLGGILPTIIKYLHIYDCEKQVHLQEVKKMCNNAFWISK